MTNTKPDPTRTVIARSAREVISAWRFVYRRYVDTGLIAPNPHRIHTVPQAVHPGTAVITKRAGSAISSTISCYLDGPLGLPLDDVYADTLAEARAEGRRMIEIGLFAEQPGLSIEETSRPVNNVLEMMRYTFWFGVHQGATHFICGIPPRRTKLYRRLLGFEPVGSVKSYRTVADNPVQLMEVETAHLLAEGSRYRGIDYFLKNPVSRESFEPRHRLSRKDLNRSSLGAFLAGQTALKKAS